MHVRLPRLALAATLATLMTAALAVAPDTALAMRCQVGALPTRWIYDDMDIHAFGISCAAAMYGADRIIGSGKVYGRHARFRVRRWRCVRQIRPNRSFGSLAYVRCRTSGGRMTFTLQP